MTKFLLKKRFSLSFLGDEWKECYLDFDAFTVKDVRDELPALSKIDETKSEEVTSGLSAMLSLLEKKFLGGKGINEKKEVVDIVASDIEELPLEVVSKAIGFLSQGLVAETPKV